MSPSLQSRPLRTAVVTFVAGAVAVTLFAVVVLGDSLDEAALGSLGYALGSAIGAYIAAAGPDW